MDMVKQVLFGLIFEELGGFPKRTSPPLPSIIDKIFPKCIHRLGDVRLRHLGDAYGKPNHLLNNLKIKKHRFYELSVVPMFI
jgi:hypothetical protein